MIFAHLTKHWISRRSEYSFSSWMLSIARSMRVLAYYREHRALCRLGVYRDHVAQTSNDDLFHHLSHRDYLMKGLPARQRVQAVLSHYRFEETTFNDAYKAAVYGLRCLPLWQHEGDGSSFAIQLEMASRSNAEGDQPAAFRQLECLAQLHAHPLHLKVRVLRARGAVYFAIHAAEVAFGQGIHVYADGQAVGPRGNDHVNVFVIEEIPRISKRHLVRKGARDRRLTGFWLRRPPDF